MQWSKGTDEDPHGVQKLLSLLRAQQDEPGQADVTPGQSSTSSVTPSAIPDGAERSSTSAVESQEGRRADWQEQLDRIRRSGTLPSKSSDQDLRHISFAQALPHLTQLSKDDEFLRKLLLLKTEQDKFERNLAEERKSIAADERNSSSRGPADESEIARWDRQALARWDGLYGRQQERLQLLGVPCFYATRDPAQIRKQQRVFDVLSSLLE